MIHVVLPAQYLRQASLHLVEPQKRLMLAVLRTVVDDYGGAPHTRAANRGAISRRDAQQAAAYVASRDRSWPFSFESICETIGLDPDRLRQGLREMVRETAGAG
jgi:hypothetical protein